MTLDITARNLADRLVDKFGKTVTLRRTPQDSYSPVDGGGGDDQTPTDYTVKVTPPTDFMFKKIDGTLIEEGDEVVSLPALNSPITPVLDTDTVIMDGNRWEIRQLGRLWSGELVAMYILHLTK
jgi:hypothetical protein